jgi:hypothetical protein
VIGHDVTLANKPVTQTVLPVLNTMSGDLGNVCALSGELRNELDLKQTGQLLYLQQLTIGSCQEI